MGLIIGEKQYVNILWQSPSKTLWKILAWMLNPKDSFLTVYSVKLYTILSGRQILPLVSKTWSAEGRNNLFKKALLISKIGDVLVISLIISYQ